MLPAYLSVLCLPQINRMFPIQDVIPLIRARSPPPERRTILEQDDLARLSAKIVSTKTPRRAVVSIKSDRMHIFLHDKKQIRRCVWDGVLSFDDKKKIVSYMLQWHRAAGDDQFEYALSNTEDQQIFAEVWTELQDASMS